MIAITTKVSSGRPSPFALLVLAGGRTDPPRFGEALSRRLHLAACSAARLRRLRLSAHWRVAGLARISSGGDGAV